jgi:hypothetical protein
MVRNLETLKWLMRRSFVSFHKSMALSSSILLIGTRVSEIRINISIVSNFKPAHGTKHTSSAVSVISKSNSCP